MVPETVVELAGDAYPFEAVQDVLAVMKAFGSWHWDVTAADADLIGSLMKERVIILHGGAALPGPEFEYLWIKIQEWNR